MSINLFNACVCFRRAIEQTPKTLLSLRLKGFPKGSCGDACPILGLYLERTGFGLFDYVCGEWNKGDFYCSHAWLEKDDILVDITGDQFYCRPPVYVGTKDMFYLSFRVLPSSRHVYYTPLKFQLHLLEDYSKIIDFIET